MGFAVPLSRYDPSRTVPFRNLGERKMGKKNLILNARVGCAPSASGHRTRLGNDMIDGNLTAM
jgi:hypothetical protein